MVDELPLVEEIFSRCHVLDGIWEIYGTCRENMGKMVGKVGEDIRFPLWCSMGPFFPLQFEIAMMSSSPTSFVDSNFKGEVTRQHQGSQKGNRIAI